MVVSAVPLSPSMANRALARIPGLVGRLPAKPVPEDDKKPRSRSTKAFNTGLLAALTFVVGAGISIAIWQSGNARPSSTQANRSVAVLFTDDFSTINSSTWSTESGSVRLAALDSPSQCYAFEPGNVDIVNPNGENGMLRIQSKPLLSPVSCTDSLLSADSTSRTTNWTSGSIVSRNKRAFMWAGQDTANGDRCHSVFIETRIKLPTTNGTQGSFWMLPEPQPRVAARRFQQECQSLSADCGAYGAWPKSGEINIVRHVNSETAVSSGTVQVGQAAAEGHRWDGAKLDLGAGAVNDWKVFLLEWHCTYLKVSVNG